MSNWVSRTSPTFEQKALKGRFFMISYDVSRDAMAMQGDCAILSNLR
jgi:hypothetical protein